MVHYTQALMVQTSLIFAVKTFDVDKLSDPLPLKLHVLRQEQAQDSYTVETIAWL